MSDTLRKKSLPDFLQFFPENVRSIILTCILSVSAGFSAVGFLFLINRIYICTYRIFAEKSVLYFSVASFILIMSTSLLVGLLLTVFSKEAAGSGIPQVKTAYWKELGYIPFKPVLVKFIAGILSIGGGNSLGREGPSVYIGSGMASNLAGVFGVPVRQRRGAAAVGASAGLAAAFNTPLAAITFIIEEIVGDLNNRHLGHVFLAAVIGAFTVHALLGRNPAFSIPSIDKISWLHYCVVPVVALAASAAGVFFQRATIFLSGRLKKQKKVPGWALPVVGGFITWAVGCSVFWATGKTGVFGLGYTDLSNALNNNFSWKIAGVLVGAKLVTTIACYSFGGCGGIFAPTLFIGGLTGCCIAGIADIWLPLTPADHIVLAAVGMSACLGVLLRAPLTSILIVFEMTHQFSLVPALMLGTLISQAIAHRSGKLNFYEAILIQSGHELHKIRPPVDLHSWQNLAVSAIISPNPVGLHDLSPQSIREILDNHPYNVFPVFSGARVTGMVTRQQLQSSLAGNKSPEPLATGCCYTDQTVGEVGNRFVESATNALIALDRETSAIKGIITLHDLIRAQAALQNG